MLKKIYGYFSVITLLFSIIIVSTRIANAQYVCVPSGTPIPITGSINTADPLQTGRIVRDRLPSSCTGKTNTLQNSTPVRYDVQTFTNPTGKAACVTVDVNFAGCGFNDLEPVAYSVFNPANPAANVIGDLGFSTFESGSFSFRVSAGASFSVVVHEITPNAGCPNYNYTVSYATNCRQPGLDRNNDGIAELGMYSPQGVWKIFNLTNNTTTFTQFGLNIDTPVIGDYNGDGQADLTVFRPDGGVWYSFLTPNFTFRANQWGLGTDKPIRGDIDRDGKDDLIVFRPSNGVWYTLLSSTNNFTAYQWGLDVDIPLSGDFDGDRITDYAVYRPDVGGVGYWYIQLSNFNYSFFTPFQWGLPTDIPVPADYDGDAITDIAVYRPSNGVWYVLLSSPNNPSPFLFYQFGISEDIPQPADFDGDGKADFAVYRPSVQTWYIFGTSTGFRAKQFGAVGDRPVSTPAY